MTNNQDNVIRKPNQLKRWAKRWRRRFIKFRKTRETLAKDFFPPERIVQDDGIHTKLNYQSIADSQRRSMSLLIIFIVLFSLGFIVTIFWLSEADELVSIEDTENYTRYIQKIEINVFDQSSDSTKVQEAVLGSPKPSETLTEEERMLEDNTSMYWSIFFTRFLLVRILIGITLGIILAFLIRLYFRIRNDRAVNIHKEEALSTIQYVARGEWKLKYNDTTKNYETVDHISEKGADVLTTEQFLQTLPIRTLFKAPSEKKGRNKRKNQMDKDLVEILNQIKVTLGNIEGELHGIRKDQEKTRNSDSSGGTG